MGLRAFLVPLAGSARLRYPQFLLFASGALVWSSVYIIVGYVLGGEVEGFGHRLLASEILLVSTLALALVAYLGGSSS
jgi:membrane protein DedA with SNARE-associated domain